MNAHEALTRLIAKAAGRRVAARAAKHMRTLPAVLSGDDSGLGNAWEEFCVQVQGEESFYWETYVDTVKDAIRGALSSQKPFEIIAMWLQSDAAYDWEAGENDPGANPPVVLDPDVVDWVYDFVRDLADASRHPRVVRSLAHDAERD